MANVIPVEFKRNMQARPRPPLGASADILIFTGVRFERLEESAGATPPDVRPEGEGRRNLAV